MAIYLSTNMQRWKIGSGNLVVMQGDITTLEVDAIVNAANSRLAGGGGVDGAIHDAAGIISLQRACKKIIAEIGTLPVGEAVITPGFGLSARHIIHTVGPVWHGGDRDEPRLLRQAYANSLLLAHQHELHSIAFPAISCGVYGYPAEQAAGTALGELKSGLQDGLVSEIFMVLHGRTAFDVWRNAAEDCL